MKGAVVVDEERCRWSGLKREWEGALVVWLRRVEARVVLNGEGWETEEGRC